MQLAHIEALIAPIGSDDPCGANLEYGDAAFTALERATQSKPEQQIGSTIVPAEEPDWKAVGRQAVDLLARTKDLRVAVHLTKALLNTEGLKGLAEGLTLLDRLVQAYWEGLHPRLDPDDDHDPTMRLNILATLSAADVLSRVRTAPLIVSRTVGRFSFRDVEAAAADASPASNGGGPVTTATIEAAAMDCDLAALQEQTAAAVTGTAAFKNLESTLVEKVGSEMAPSFGPLISLLQKIAGFLQAILARRAPAGNAAPETAGVPGAAAVASADGEIRTRDDVLRTLGRISAYYQKHEPSSPIPLFVERCKRLVTMSFVEIMRELVPDGIKQIETLAGQKQE
jgi:type VI secretion system protein ImpA